MQTRVTAAMRAASPHGLAGASGGSTAIARPHTATVESPSSQANRCAVDIAQPAAHRLSIRGGKGNAKPRKPAQTLAKCCVVRAAERHISPRYPEQFGESQNTSAEAVSKALQPPPL